MGQSRIGTSGFGAIFGFHIERHGMWISDQPVHRSGGMHRAIQKMNCDNSVAVMMHNITRNPMLQLRCSKTHLSCASFKVGIQVSSLIIEKVHGFNVSRKSSNLH